MFYLSVQKHRMKKIIHS